MSVRFTRKIMRQQKGNPTDDYAVYLHRVLNRIDVEKDAFYSGSPITNGAAVFQRCADELFGPLPRKTYTDSLDYIESIMRSFEAYDKQTVRVYNYTNDIKLHFLPKYIAYGIQDAGLAPQRFNDTIRTMITPGSYLDPASRSQGDITCGFNRSLTQSELMQLGMPTLTSIAPTLNDNKSCKLTINFVEDTSLNILFYKNFKIKSGDACYFRGNRVKNAYFNSNNIAWSEAFKYIICKELGDTLQAYYGKLCSMLIDDGQRKICLFTNDSILTLRCKLLNLQVVYNVKIGQSDRIFYRHPQMTYVEDGFAQIWRENVMIHNNAVIESINTRLHKGVYYLINGRQKLFNSKSNIIHVLVEYIQHTSRLTTDFIAINHNTMKLEDYRKKSIAYQMPQLFINSVLNPCALALPIFTEDDRQELIANNAVMSGGGSLPEFTFKTEEDNYTIDREYGDSDPPYVIVGRALYNALRSREPSARCQELCYIVESISSMLYIYYNYMAITSYDDRVIDWILHQYEENTLGQQTADEFEAAYNEIVKENMEHHNRYINMNTEAVPFERPVLDTGIMAVGGRRRKRKTVRRRFVHINI